MSKLADIIRLCETAREDEARKRLLSADQPFPSDPQTLFQLATLHDRLGLESRSVPYYLAAIEKGLPEDQLREAYVGLGSTYRVLGRYAEAKEVFEKALAAFPEANELKIFQAMTLYNLGQMHEAVGSLLRILAETSSDERVRYYERAIELYARDLDRVQGEAG